MVLNVMALKHLVLGSGEDGDGDMETHVDHLVWRGSLLVVHS